MFCKKCGTELPKEVNFCPKCGADVSENNYISLDKEPIEEFANNNSEIISDENKYNKKHKRKKNKILIIVIIILAVIIIIGGAFIYFKSKVDSQIDLVSSNINSGNLTEASTNLTTLKNISGPFEQSEINKLSTAISNATTYANDITEINTAISNGDVKTASSLIKNLEGKELPEYLAKDLATATTNLTNAMESSEKSAVNNTKTKLEGQMENTLKSIYSSLGIDSQLLTNNIGVDENSTPNLSELTSILSGNNINYAQYTNPIFGFSMMYPSFLTNETTSTDGSAVMLANNNYTVNLTAWGSNNIYDDTASSLYNENLSNVSSVATEVGYTHLGSNYYVISWVQGNEICYEYTAVGIGSENGFLISYPSSCKKYFDSIINYMYNQFQTGNLSQEY